MSYRDRLIKTVLLQLECRREISDLLLILFRFKKGLMTSDISII